MQLVMRRAPCTHAAPQADPTVGKKNKFKQKKEQIIYKVKNLSFTEVEYSSVLGSGSIKAKAGSSLPSFVEGDVGGKGRRCATAPAHPTLVLIH